MLKIHQDSWHYWVWRLGRNQHSRPHNLCKYFWHIVLKVVAALVVSGLALVGLGALIYLIYGLGILVYGHPAETAMYVGLAILGVLAVIGLVLLTKRLYERHVERVRLRRDYNRLVAQGQAEPVRTPSPFWLWIKARKQKVCPLIEVVDE